MKRKSESESLTLSKRKEQLHQQSDQFRSALSTDLNEIKIDLSKWGKDFLIIGGSLYAVYKIYKLFRGNDDSLLEEATTQPQSIVVTNESSSVIVAKVKEQITLFLLALALKKLKEYLNKQTNE